MTPLSHAGSLSTAESSARGGSMKRSEHALEEFSSGLNCSQAVLAEYAEELGVDFEIAQRIACGFGGGMGRMGGTCGAVTGAFMVIGLKACAPDPRDAFAKARTYTLVQAFAEEFEARHQTLSCRELLECDISTPEGFDEARRSGVLAERCPAYVSDAVEILEEMF
jgi:C_GCAxxG_C_C family probable redox protein